MHQADIRAYQEKVARIGEMHLEIERQFLEFESAVPYKYNATIATCLYSPRLYNILQGIGSNVDAMMKLLLEIFALSPQEDKMPSWLDTLDSKALLAKQTIVVRGMSIALTPFARSGIGKVPNWWAGYNKTKHRVADGGARYATLGNTMDALGALVILLHISRRLLAGSAYLPSGIHDGSNWKDISKDYIDAFEAVKFEEYFRFPLTETEKEQRYLISKEHDFRSKVFFYAMQLKQPRRNLNDTDESQLTRD